MDDPLHHLLRLAGFEPLTPTEAYKCRDHTELVFSALRKRGVAEMDLPRFADKIAMAGRSAGQRDVSKDNRVGAEEIEQAVDRIAKGLQHIADGLHTISFARATTTPSSITRAESLEALHRALVGLIAEAVANGVGAGDDFDEKVVSSIPTFEPGGWHNPWTGRFADAAAKVAIVKSAFPRASYHAQKKDRDAWLGRLVPELAKVYTEITGERAVISNPSEKAPHGWRCPFAQFIADLWGYLDPTDAPCPGDDQIKLALTPNIGR
jgi:hypothetical protein